MCAFVIREDGYRYSGTSKSCPKCGHLRLETKQGTDADFDMNGWFYSTNFTCLNVKCKHQWAEKVVVESGGFKL